jgi:hypothetical protein
MKERRKRDTKKISFFLKHAKELERKHAGRYIAVVNNKVVAVGSNRLEVYQSAIKKIPKNKGVGVFYLPLKEEVLTAL